ncbi:MAG: condensation domain-containing protein, partial [Psychrosphaera sp.]|nr:condensation domain-containing protein [Psychrosphaera sp.]
MNEAVAKDMNQVFDLSHDLLLRVQLLKLSNQSHVMLFNMHHIASDGWSTGILIREFSTLYSAYVQGKSNPLAPLKIQYADFAHWQRQWLEGDVMASQLNYWTQQLAGIPTVHSLPLDKVRGAQQGFNGKAWPKIINADLSQQINDLCQQQGVTLFMLLQTAFSVLLSRYSNETDIVMGSPIAGRLHQDVEPLIGFFVNTLVLRTNLEQSPTFSDLLQQNKQMILDAYANQSVSFEMLVEAIAPQRSLSHSPLFQVMIVLQNNEQQTLTLPGLELRQVAQQSRNIKYDLELSIAEMANGSLSLSWQYNVDLFDAQRVKRMADNFVVLLESIVKTSELTQDQSVNQLTLLTDSEQQDLLIEFNGRQVDYPVQPCIHQLFERQAIAAPDAVALVCGDKQLSYQQVNERSNRLAHYLIEQGVKPGSLVGLHIERGFDMVCALLAILKTGGAYVPLDPGYPNNRLENMLQDSQLKYLLTRADSNADLDLSEDVKVLAIAADPTQQITLAYAQSNPDVAELSPTDLAYVIYTSGSTGLPKGVMIEHQSAVQMLNWAQQNYSKIMLANVLASTSICFDLSVFELFAPLSVGGTAVIVDDALALQQSDFCTELSLINTVPSVIQTLLDIDAIPASVKTVNLAGELLQQSVVDQLYARGIEQVFDLYGPSEDTTYSTRMLRTPDGVNAIGKPITNTQAYLLDPMLNLVPKGVEGELYLGGKGLARGYLNQPQMTSD